MRAVPVQVVRVGIDETLRIDDPRRPGAIRFEIGVAGCDTAIDEGDADAGFTLLGMFAGAPVAQNFLIKSNDTFAGINTYGPVAVIVGMVFCLALGFLMREKG